MTHYDPDLQRFEFLYKDPHGKVMRKKVRIQYPDRRPLPSGRTKDMWFEWEKGGEGTGWKKGSPKEHFFYNADRLSAAPLDETVFIVEGENKCEALKSLGFLGVSNDTGSSGKWKKEWVPLFAGRAIVVLPDNDSPGRRHAQDVKALLGPVADNLAVLELPGLPPKGDIIDWLDDASNTKEKLCELSSEALKQSMFNRPGEANEGEESPGGLSGKLASEYQERRPRWFLKPWVPAEMLTLVVGVGGAGKSSLVAYLLSKANKSVLLPGYEEVFEVLTLPRLKRHGVNLQTVRVLPERAWRLPDDEEKLIHIVKSHGAELVCVDPISSYLPADGNENDAAVARNCLESFARVATTTGAAVVGVRHPGKNAANVMAGSREWRNVPRSIVELIVDPAPPASPKQRYISIYRSSLGQEEPPTEFRLVGAKDEPVVFTLAGQMDQGMLTLRQAVPDDTDRSKVQEAIDLLQGVLANGEMESVEVFSIGDREKLSEHCLRRAAKAIGVRFRRTGQGRDHKCLWSLSPNERNE